MAFITDQQTLNDLNIFGRRDQESIYGLFNGTVTRNGAALLEDMLRHPLPTAEAIQARSAIFQYFFSCGGVFPFRSELFDVAEAYLLVTDERTRLSGDHQSIGSRMASLIADDNGYKNIYKGVMALGEIVQTLHAFLKALPASRTPVPGPYEEEKEQIRALLAPEDMQSLLKEDKGSKLSFSRIAFYDSSLRFRHRDHLRRLLQHIYRLDVYIAVGRIAAERKFIFPRVFQPEKHRMVLQGVYHPLVAQAVPNTLAITQSNHVLFLTGANMAGKSTFMKAVGIAVFLAHTGFPVAARQMEFSVMDGIYTTINLPDNLGMGASHFYAEVLRVKKIAKELGHGKRLFVIFDELFRGTNVKDAYEATVALTSAFARRRASIFIISTHIIEAGEILTRETGGIRPIYLPTRMEGNKPVYSYKLEEGISGDRHGMVIVQNEGIPGMLKRGRDGKKTASGGEPFLTDRQTLDDLNLTGKYRPDSVYGLFNQVQTEGAVRLLDEFFRHPLMDADEINRRSSRWRHLQDKCPDFPFTRQQLGLVEDYLYVGAGSSRLMNTALLLRLKMLEALVKDKRYAAIAEGVSGVIAFIYDCRVFIRQFDKIAGPMQKEVKEMTDILGDPRLAHLPPGREAGVLPWASVARLHHLFGHILQGLLSRACAILYEFDLWITVGKVARERGFSQARALPMESNRLFAAGLRHPGLEKAVGNTIAFNGDNNVIFLTGANMAGKSTLMKSFGIALYLAHLGFPVAAEEMQFSVKEGLYSSINVQDDLALGYSHFYAEVLRVKLVAEAVSQGKNMVVIFDELFKGTNVKDAYDATLAVTEAFAAYRNCFFVVSTHIVEVGEALQKGAENLQFAYLPTVMEGINPTYPYTLKKGISSDRHGMLIIENEGILSIIG